MDSRFSLYFTDYQAPELIRTEFVHSSLGMLQISNRGISDIHGQGCFLWSRAVKALSVLMTEAAIADPARGLVGGRGSLAASLDYAIAKQPIWLLDMFGTDRMGRCLILKIVRRLNPAMKRKGPVSIYLNSHSGDRLPIQILCDDEKIPVGDETFIANLRRSVELDLRSAA